MNCYMQRHWFLCNKEMSENPKNRSKQLILKEKIFVSSEQLQKLNEIFRKDVTYDNITSHKKPGHALSPEDTFLEKPQREGSN